MPLAATLAVLVLAQTLLLLVPWLAVKATFYSPPDPHGNLEHARTARAAEWRIDYPLSIGLVVLGALWIDHQYGVLLAVYLALLTRLLVFQATNSRRSVPVLTLAFPWLLAPVLAWTAVTLAAFHLVPVLSGWLDWVVAVVVSFGVPTQLLGFAAIAFRPVLITGKRWRFRRRLCGRWVGSAGYWTVCDVRAGEVGISPGGKGNAVLLVFRQTSVDLPFPDGEPPDYLVEVSYDRQWRPPEDRLATLRLADYPGPGPIKAAMFGATGYGIRAARARLDEELVVIVEELRLHGDDFFQFIGQLVPQGRVHGRAADVDGAEP